MANALTANDFAFALEALGPFEPSPHFAVAVSGGADSMCLVLLAQHYAQSIGGHITALTVDHGLRAESAEEAQQVQAWLRAHGIAQVTLNWQPEAVHANVQSQAREARYRLMRDWCRKHQVLWLLTAHHADDQQETLLLRQQRGSTRFGLCGMSPVAELFGIHVLRPLLGFSKAQLHATLEAARQSWLDDPSNENPRFARTHARQSLQHPHAAADVLESRRASNAQWRRCTEGQMATLMARHTHIFPEGYLQASPEIFTSPKREMALRLLSHMLETISGQAYPARLSTLEATLARVLSGTRCTAHGCVLWPRLKRKNPHILIFRELAACAPMSARAATPLRWDQRFEIFIESKEPLNEAELRPLGQHHVPATLPAHLADLPKALIATFPALWKLERVLIAPHIHSHRNASSTLAMKALFSPMKPLGKPAFCVIDEKKNTRKVG